MIFRKYQAPGRDDQLVAATGIIIFLIIGIFYFWQRSITNNGLIDFEDMPSRQVSYVVDINSAGWPEFANLPGIGEKLARQIVLHREQFGPFESTQELIDISGIGNAKLDKIRPFLSVKLSRSIGKQAHDRTQAHDHQGE